VLCKGVVVLVGDVGGCGADLADAGGAAEGEDGGDVHGIKGGEEGVGRLALASWGHGCCYRVRPFCGNVLLQVGSAFAAGV